MEINEIQKAIQNLEKAYNTFEKGILKSKLSLLERDGVIQRFEFTIELTWKTLKKILRYEGSNDNLFPKEIFKEFKRKGFLDDLEVFFNFLDSRNLFSHIYSETEVEELFEDIKGNYKAIKLLIEKLKNNY